ncbi:MAG: hypothetical protein D6705_01745 [Deltaproteobacteria bacterium]|nr:MAG: hypothetical protein D6705_01745 [Deltaproteobacteria bacterium]
MRRALERLRRVRTIVRNRRRARLAAAEGALARARETERRATDAIRNAPRLADAATCELARSVLDAARRDTESAEAVVDGTRTSLGDAEAALARIEKILERLSLRMEDERNAEEQRELDDMALASHARRRHGGATILALLAALSSAPACSKTAEDDAPAQTEVEGSTGDEGEAAGSGGSTGGAHDASADEVAETAVAERRPMELPDWIEELDEEHPLRRAHHDLAEAMRKRLEEQAAEALALTEARAEVERARKELDARLAGIDALSAELDERLGVGAEARKRRLSRIQTLAGLLAGMTPQAGASIVANMTDEDAKDVLLALAKENQRKASKLMAAMPPERAASLGERYLSRDPEAAQQLLEPPPPPPELPNGAGAPASPPAPPASGPTGEAAPEEEAT